MKRLVILGMLMIVFVLCEAQPQYTSSNLINELRSTSIHLGDTSVSLGALLDKSFEIALYAEKLKADRDSLLFIIAQKDSVIAADERIYKLQTKVDSSNVFAFKKLDGLYSSLETDYNKLKRAKKLRPALGIGADVKYSLPAQMISNGSLTVKPGVFLSDRYLFLLNLGLDVGKKFDVGVLLGASGVVIF